MLFSVIVPVYNVELYLEECVESILNQSFKDFEVVLVDDGSSDSSGSICDSYAREYSFIKCVHKKNGGLSSAWIEGLNYVEGEYICSIDSDDYVETDMLERVSEIIRKYHSEIIVYGYKSVSDDGESPNVIRANGGYYSRERIEKELLPGLINCGAIVNRSNIYLSRINKTIKKDLLLNNSVYYRDDISYGEDNMWTIPNVLSADSIYIIEDYYPYCYRYNPQSITHVYNKNLWRKFGILDKLVFQMAIDFNRPEMKVQIMRDCAFHGIMTINNEMISNHTFVNKMKRIKRIINNKNVRKGIHCMDYSKCGMKEKINIGLVKLRSPLLIMLYKTLSGSIRRRKTK